MQDENIGHIYLAIDLKSYYASVELADRKYNPLTTNLVVADDSRTEKTICLAVSPSLKALGISGRARLFEVIQRVKEVNAERYGKARRLGVLPKGEDGKYHFTSSSFDAEALEADPSLEVAYIVAPPRMRLYEKISTQIFGIYSKYISPDDIHVYSIDEVFIDATAYLNTYHMTAHELAITMIREVLYTTGITATCGIGTNMYLAKVAMDIVAKHVPADNDGVRIAELDEQSYREKLWCHTPITDFWRVGGGIAKRLAENHACYTMGDVARLSVRNEAELYDDFGINAELLIDHAWGWEPTEISTIKSYKPQTNSLSSGQVLMEPYEYVKAKLIVREMTELLVLDLVRKGLVTKQVTLTVGYDRTSIEYAYRGKTIAESSFRVVKTGKIYHGKVKADPYGRPHPAHAHGTGNVDRWTSSTKRIMDVMMELFERIVDPDLTVRRINVVAANLIPENEIPEEGPQQLSLFVDYDALEKQKQKDDAEDDRERRIQKATLLLQAKYGKNALLKGMNLQEGATTIQRNGQVGGHRAGDEDTKPVSRKKSTPAHENGGDADVY